MKAVKNIEHSTVANARVRRRKINPASPPTTVELHGVRIHFPFKPYACQEAYMKKVLEALLRGENALLESPTGTGKTLCLLCSALAWQREQSRLLQQQQSQQVILSQSSKSAGESPKIRVPTIIYASRTHSQLSQVVRELRNTRYRPLHAVLGSREQMCVNPKVKKPTSNSADINHDCNKLGKERKCKFRNNLEGFVAPANEEGGTGNDCQPVMDMEDLVKMGNDHKVCPFYYTRSQVENAELILVPYNYLFDKDAKDSTLQAIDWKNSVVIFDEAHNLESFASDSASFDLSSTDIAGCITDISRTISYVDAALEANHGLKRENLVRLKAIFLKLENYIDNLSHQCAYAGEFIIEIFRQGYITHANHEILVDELRKVNDYLIDMKGSSRGSSNLDHFAHCLKRVFSHSLESRCLAKAAFYRVYVSPKPSENQRGSGRTVSYWCFAPSLAMEELTARSIIVTSGTLAPLKGLSMELGLKFPHMLENPHIITEKQIHVRVIGKGVSGKILSSSYERRQNGDYYAELGNTLVSLAKIVPDGMLVFFPSYGVMETCIERWGGPSTSRHTYSGDKGNNFFAPRQRKQPPKKFVFVCTPTIYFDETITRTPWKRLTGTKSVVIEPRSSADLPDAISEFQRLLAAPKSRGCILMGVCRGKISEGIDFANEQSRAVVITGLPFPPTTDPKIKMKREYLEAMRARIASKPSINAGFKEDAAMTSLDMLSGNEWYTQQAHRAVNQAIGRVIRNRSDYGAVILLDERFGYNHNQDGLSSWLRPHIKRDEGFGAAIKGLATFYKEARCQAEELAKLEREAKPVELIYDDDEENDIITKVAIVRGPSIETENAVNGSADSENRKPVRDYVAPCDVISRMDVREVKRIESKLTNEQQINGAKKMESGNFDAVFKQKSTTRSNASVFFERAKKLFSSDELSTVKKAVIAMKAHSDKRDTRSYSDAARQILCLINKHDHIENRLGKDEPRMLLLFLDLQARSWRERIQTMAMCMVFDSSSLCRLCGAYLPESQQRLVRADMVVLLQQWWCSNESSSATRQQFVTKSKEILLVLLKTNRPPLLDAFMKLVPKETQFEARAVVDQLKASFEIEKLKATDRQGKGEAALDSERFKAASISQVSHDKTERVICSSKALSKEHQNLKRPFEMSHSFSNPYTKKMSQQPGPIDEATPQRSSRPSSLSSVLKNLERASPYVPPTVGGLADAAKTFQIQSNLKLAKEMSCPICTAAGLVEPFIAECGHIACLGCWKAWLDRSETCPTCRQPTCKTSLARVVFETHPGAQVMAEHCLNHPVSGKQRGQDEVGSSDEELEIC